ncbi:MAG: cation diffusion facilitator family transporter, partial [Elusimicrobia bacterium]|nr:cation diffusion facilitator family transporter [Elusimicrobiota bacterium]
AAIFAYISVAISGKPPDQGHPYGHEKAENVSGVVEALLIFIASLLIIIESVRKIIKHEEIESIGIGFVVMLVSAIVNFFVSTRLYKVAREEHSIALEADALHLKVDMYTSIGVAAGLFVIWLTKLNFLDPILAICIALFILYEATEMLIRAFQPLMDAKLSDTEIEAIKQVMTDHQNIFVDYHELRTRRAGNIKHIDLHLTIPQRMTIKEFHDISEHLESDIQNTLEYTRVLIHAEPCDNLCNTCNFNINCKYR